MAPVILFSVFYPGRGRKNKSREALLLLRMLQHIHHPNLCCVFLNKAKAVKIVFLLHMIEGR